ncbi:MAG: hypothetical protein ABIS50_01935 [Luteolibacter sp.]|uniref:hypothetical protein n=1 Tax=Luteolibacter sp. TaxID=1962973 RepID=UPI0032675D83
MPVSAHEGDGTGGEDARKRAKIVYYQEKPAKEIEFPPLPQPRNLKPSEYAGKIADAAKPTLLPDPSQALDEALAGSTRLGTPITPRTPECFPAEQRDLFWQMDKVAGLDGKLVPIDFDVNRDGHISNLPPNVKRQDQVDSERDAIRGRNTWVLWGGGNEVFWNWLQQEGYGTHDFLILLDSRQRDRRFTNDGLINQPGMRGMTINDDPSKRILGLYLDLPGDPTEKEKNPILMRPPPAPASPTASGPNGGYGEPGNYDYAAPLKDNKEFYDAQSRKLPEPVDIPTPPPGHDDRLFKAGDEELYKYILGKLPQDGVDPKIYGYPSGIVGLRLYPNPDFFGSTDAAALARRYWKNRVEDNHDRFYTDPAVNADRRLVRPFRVSMSCGFCHVGPHPLNPPADPNHPEWENLSNIIGNQYWRPQKAIGHLLPRNNFIHHFVGSQQPGTIDTSQVASDQINNSNTINAVFDVPARLAWAENLPLENQSAGNLRLPTVRFPDGKTSRAVPRVLIDGSDSIGAFGALARVYLNIGTYYEQWEKTNNIFIGFSKQRPFSLETCQRNSVYWVTNEKYRAGYLRDFFTMKQQMPVTPKPPDSQAAKEDPVPPPVAAPGTKSSSEPLPPHNSTGPMKLRTAAHGAGGTTDWFGSFKYGGVEVPGHDREQRLAGRKVWLFNCAICHSSKQPAGFALNFSQDWEKEPVPKADEAAIYTLPMSFADWDKFRASPAMKDYRRRLIDLVSKQANDVSFDEKADPALADHPFWKDNYLSTDIRIPVTLVGTNAARALGTNGVSGHMWADFTSDTYKALRSVGTVRYYNPYSPKSLDFYGNNADFPAPAGGVGYYRPASHISLWATAPFLHNNTLGLFNNDPSVHGRLAAFDDGIRKLLNQKDRAKHSMAGGPPAPYGAVRIGDLRPEANLAARKDPGFIYRIPRETQVQIGPSFIRPLVAGVAGEVVTQFLSIWLWVLLAVAGVLIAWHTRARHAGFVLLADSILIGVLLLLSGTGGTGRGAMVIPVLIMALSNVLELSHKGWWILVIGLGLLGGWFLTLKPQTEKRGPKNILIAVGITLVLLWFLTLIFGGGTAAGYLTRVALWLRMAGFFAWIPLGILAACVASRVYIRYGGDGIARFIHTGIVIGIIMVGFIAHQFINGRLVVDGQITGVEVGPIPPGTPVNFLMNLNPDSPNLPKAVVSMFYGITRIKKENLEGEGAWKAFSDEAGEALMSASKCPDYVLDRGHWFGEGLSIDDKENLIAFLQTL